MKHGFVKLALAKAEIRLGAVSHNVEEIKRLSQKAIKEKAEVIAFGELSLTGATLEDMRNYSTILESAERGLKELVDFSKTCPIIIVCGFPKLVNGSIVSCAAVIEGGVLHDTVESQSNNYAVVTTFKCPSLSLNFGVVLGESFSTTFVEHPQLVINISKGVALIDSYYERNQTIETISRHHKCAYAYVCSGFNESVGCNIYSGDRIVFELGEKILAQEGDNEELYFAEIDIDSVSKHRVLSSSNLEPLVSYGESGIEIPAKNHNADITRHVDNLPYVPDNAEFERIFEILGRGVFTRMKQAKAEKLILGLSGGLDSTSVLVSVARMFEKYGLNKKNIICVSLPSAPSSKRTRNNADALIQAFGVTGMTIPINDAVSQHMKDIGHSSTTDIVYENLQARERTQILLDLANKYNALMLGTSDLSEIALGWATYGGDQIAHYNINSGLTKTLIRAMLRNYCLITSNEQAAHIITDVLDTPISPELIEGQDTEKTLGPYEVHDFYLYNLIIKGFNVGKVEYLATRAFPDIKRELLLEYLETFITRFFANQFKRHASCEGIRISYYDLSQKKIPSGFSPDEFLKELRGLKDEKTKKVAKKK
ncbi:MAG: NAD(+) synthase [Firmicutes bacterium]|nr:NAD(+) synthase [Bacillota bacterium]MCL2256336.1 NAD(+) synthase [Bacillota bacterium]